MTEASCKCNAPGVTGYDGVRAIVDAHLGQGDALIDVLHQVQEALGTSSLPEEAAKIVARGLGVPLSKVYGVATFYSFFSPKPRGKYVIRMCASAPCHVEGAAKVYREFARVLGIAPGQTTYDGKFSLELTECLGICHAAPAALINDKVYEHITPDQVKDIVREYM
jgi:NADH:ubiquinone oxidoreductase subunit E